MNRDPRPLGVAGRPLRWPAFSLALVAVAMLAGCADMSGIAPVARLNEPALPAAPAASGADVTSALGARWWHGFGDAQLDTLMDRALAGNPNLRVAQARLARAQAVIEVADAATLPQLNGSFDATRQLYTKNGAVPAPLAGSIRESGTLQLSASWEIDFFGRHQAALDAALGQARAAVADRDAAAVLLSTNVARGWFQLARIEAQLQVARRTLTQREETLRLVGDRVSAGLDTRLELKQAETNLPDARVQIEALAEQAQLARHALAALAGDMSLADSLAAPSLDALRPVARATRVPADLLGRRADIAAARWRVEAAGRDVDNAKTQFYPNINLVAFAGFSSIGLDRLTESGSRQWGIGPAIRLPIFDAGRLRANLRGKTADLDAAVESYNAAVLDAVREAADQIASQQSIERQQAEQRRAQEAAEAAYDIALQRYRGGLGNYLQVLTAENAVLAQRRAQVDLAARVLDNQAGLIRALGGGWQADAPPVAAGPVNVSAAVATR
jgi:NodT family efflux transporter outer membrane factor (OMF) lipoprotein